MSKEPLSAIKSAHIIDDLAAQQLKAFLTTTSMTNATTTSNLAHKLSRTVTQYQRDIEDIFSIPE